VAPDRSLGKIVTTACVPARESGTPRAMPICPEDFEDDDVLPVPLDRDLRAWLAELVRATGAPPGVIVKSMLDAIRVDDEAAHRFH
jgi:hypothetical protein